MFFRKKKSEGALVSAVLTVFEAHLECGFTAADEDRDCLCTIKLVPGGEEFRFRTVKLERRITWPRETATFRRKSFEGAVVKVTLWKYDGARNRKRFLGRVKISLDSLYKMPPDGLWLDMCERRHPVPNAAAPIGRVRVLASLEEERMGISRSSSWNSLHSAGTFSARETTIHSAEPTRLELHDDETPTRTRGHAPSVESGDNASGSEVFASGNLRRRITQERAILPQSSSPTLVSSGGAAARADMPDTGHDASHRPPALHLDGISIGPSVSAQGSGKETKTIVASIGIIAARNLTPADRNGKSDPYCVLIIDGNPQRCKTGVQRETLNPVWNASFNMDVPSDAQQITIKVYDWDIVGKDFLGEVVIPFDEALRHGDRSVNGWLPLVHNSLGQPRKFGVGELGSLNVTVSVTTTASSDLVTTNSKTLKLTRKATTPSSLLPLSSERKHYRIYVEEVQSIVLPAGLSSSDVFVRIVIHSEEKQSFNTFAAPAQNASFKQSFVFQTRELDVGLSVKLILSKNPTEALAKTTVQLSSLAAGKVIEDWFPLYRRGALRTRSNAGMVRLKIERAVEDGFRHEYKLLGSVPEDYENNDVALMMHARRSFGMLRVLVAEAHDLLAMDISGTSDPYCVLNFEKIQVRTATKFKTLRPFWNEGFVFPITDPASSLRIQIFDQDMIGKDDGMGFVIVPLSLLFDHSRVPQCHATHSFWFYVQKEDLSQPNAADVRVPARSLGRLRLELSVEVTTKSVYRATLTQPLSLLFPEKTQAFNLEVFKGNARRFIAWADYFSELVNSIQALRKWRSPTLTLFVLACHITICLFLWDLLPFLFAPSIAAGLVLGGMARRTHNEDEVDIGDEDDAPGSNQIANRRSVLEHWERIKSAAGTVQTKLGKVSSTFERISHLYSWADRRVSMIVCCVTILVSLLLSCIIFLFGMRTVVLGAGCLFFRPKLKYFSGSRRNMSTDGVLEFILARSPDMIEMRRRRVATASLHSVEEVTYASNEDGARVHIHHHGDHTHAHSHMV